MKVVLAVPLFGMLALLMAASLVGIVQTEDVRGRAIMTFLFAFLVFLGVVSWRILFFSPKRYLATLSAAPVTSTEFVDCALKYFRSRCRILRLSALFVVAMGVLYAVLPFLSPAAKGYVWHLVSLVFPVGLAWRWFRAEGRMMKAVKLVESLASDERLEALRRLAGLRKNDSVAAVVTRRLAEAQSSSG